MIVKLIRTSLFTAILVLGTLGAGALPVSGEYDSLLVLLKGSNGKTRVDICNSLSRSIVYSNTGQSLKFALEALSLSQSVSYPRGESMAYNRIGVAYDVLGKFDSALRNYHKALQISERLDDPALIAGNLSNIGLTNWHVGNSKEATDYFFSALEYFEKSNNKAGLAATCNNIGLVYKSLSNMGKAIEFFNKSKNYYSQVNDQSGIAAVLTNIGYIHLQMKEFGKAESYLIQSLNIKKKLDDKYGLSITCNHLASLCMESNKFEEALTYSHKAAEYARMIDDDNELAQAYFKTSLIKTRLNDLDDALAYNNKAEKLALSIKNNKLLYDLYYNYSAIYEAKGDYKKSLEYYRKYKATEDIVINDQRFNQVYEHELKRETTKINAELAELNKQKQIQELRIEAQQLLISKRNNQILFSLALIVVILLIVYIFYLNYKHKQKLTIDEAIYQVKQQRANEVIEAELNERKRIGEELHDGLGQMLSLLKLTLTSLQKKLLLPDNPKHHKLVANAVELTDNAFNELRNISHNLAPIFLREKGMVESIRNLLDRLNESNFRVNMDFSITGEQNDSFTELTIYRAIQEILNNIIKHSGANEVNFQYMQTENELIIMVEDNGKGFNETDQLNRKGIGLKNISSRVESIGGKTHIDSVLGRGTIVTITVPKKQLAHEKNQIAVG